MKRKYPMSNNSILITLFSIGILLLMVGLLYSSFALPEIVKSIRLTSNNLNYENKEPGSWKVEKSAKWVKRDKSQITFDVDTVAKQKYQYNDIILVMDISVSMSGYKLEKAKENALELVDQVYSTTGNRMAFIQFNDKAEIYTNFTDKIEQLKYGIQSVNFNGRSSYYQALVSVEELLKDYKTEENRDCVVLFLTGSYPSSDTPNEVGYFSYLKEQYPFVTINAIQYGMSEEVLEPLRQISDNQYVVNSETTENILLEAYEATEEYSKFILTDYIDTRNFSLESSEDITVSQGKVDFNKEEQKVIWTIENLKSGSKLKMTIDTKLKEGYINQAGIYSTNSKEEVESSIDGIEERVTSEETPKISNTYQVRYEGNAPNGCIVKNIPSSENQFVLDKVSISSDIPECEGYRFQEWKVMGVEAKQINSNYFIMPESDVVLKAEWRKLSLAKSMSGEIYIAPVPKMQVALNPDTGAQEIWKYKDSVTKVVFQDRIEDIYNVKESFDLSEENNYGVMGRVVPNAEDSSTYTIYIQGDNGVIANENSSYLFSQFRRLESIEGIEYFDTSNVVDMSYMFGWCESLTSLDLRTFDTSKVTTMLNMFRDNLALTSLDISSFDTSNVTTMQWMFGGTGSLKELNLSNFNTSKVTDMTAMFAGTGLINLDLSNFDTSNVTTMRVMFNNANYLRTLNVSGWNTEKVTNMANLFGYCHELKSLDLSSFRTTNVTTIANIFIECKELETLDLSNFDTSNVTTMNGMFKDCSKLANLNLTNFDTSNVTDMGNMFNNCTSLVNLDVSSFKTSKVKNTYQMFFGCNNLSSLDVTGFDTSNVTNMCQMFAQCWTLTDLDLSRFNTSNVTDMSGMFDNCNKLKNINVSNFITSNVVNMSDMFAYCASMETLDVSNFDTSNVNNMDGMFNHCQKVSALHVDQFNTTKVTDMGNMFAWCESLTSLNLKNFDTSNVTDMCNMFYYCIRLTSLDVSNFNTSKVTNMSNMFDEINSVKTLDLSNFDTSNVTNMFCMFYGDSNLTNLTLGPKFDTSKVQTMWAMFAGCWQLTTLGITNLNLSSMANMESMFYDCTNLSATITITNPNIPKYSNIFSNAATATGAKITVNYTSSTSSLVDLMIATKSSNSNVVKGSLIS